MFTVRKAKEKDILGIQQVAHVAWHHTYEHTMRPDTRSQILTEFYGEKVLNATLMRPEVATFVAKAAGRVVGFVQALPHPVRGYEINRFYILPKYQKQGIGRL